VIPSRIERTSPDGRFAVAFGVDHVTSSYCQVWLAPIEEQEGPFIVIDNQGVRPFPGGSFVRALDGDRATAERVTRLLNSADFRFKQAAIAGNRSPNLDHETVTRLFVLFGFPDSIGAEVFEAFD
jgi:hypothetical protein